MKIKIKKVSDTAQLPVYSSEGAAAFDICSDELSYIGIGAPSSLSTGLAFEIPKGYGMLLFSRSGHGFKNDLRLSNCVGLIDSDYRGEVRVKMTQDSNVNSSIGYLVGKGERIAQGVVLPMPKIEFEEVEELSKTERGSNGFGSTGI